jgi:hypothetical protein
VTSSSIIFQYLKYSLFINVGSCFSGSGFGGAGFGGAGFGGAGFGGAGFGSSGFGFVSVNKLHIDILKLSNKN